MKFFRHDCNASESPFFQGVIEEFGFEGYGRFWALAEMCYEQLDKNDESFTERCAKTGVVFRFHPKIVRQRLRGNPKTLGRLFDFYQKTSDFRWVSTGSSWDFHIPNILKRLTPKEKQYWSQFDWGTPRREEKRREEKKREEKRVVDKPPVPAKPSPPKLHKLVEIWNENSGILGKVKTVNSARQRKIEARWKESPDDPVAYFTGIIMRIVASNFCVGKNDRGWKASFDWLLQPETHLKVDEGKYDNPKGNPPPGKKTFAQQRTENNASLFDKFENGGGNQ